MAKAKVYLHGTILDEDTICSLAELCRMCAVDLEEIQAMIEEGLITPAGSSPREWRFSLTEIRRIKTAVRLQRDLRINLPGCALALDLLDELQELRRLVRNL